MAEPGCSLRAETWKEKIVRAAGGGKKSLFDERRGISLIFCVE